MKEQEMAERNLIYKVKTGSHLYGTATKSSDTDYLGIFIPDKEYVLGVRNCEQVSLSKKVSEQGRNQAGDVDCCFYSLPRFIKLVAQCNPNLIEMLFPSEKCVEYINLYGQKVLDNASLFLSKLVKHRFLGYAHSQKHKLLAKRERMQKLQDILVTVDLWKGMGLSRLPGELFVPVCEGKLPERRYVIGTPIFEVEDICIKEIKEYGSRAEYIKTWGFDVKFAGHLFRLVYEGYQLLKEGKLEFPLPDEARILINDIRLGKYKLNEVLQMSEDLEQKLEGLYEEEGILPYSPDWDRISTFQIEMLEDFWYNK